MGRTFRGTVRSTTARTRRRKDKPSKNSRVVVRTVQRGCERCGALFHEVASAIPYGGLTTAALFSVQDDAVAYGRRIQQRVQQTLGIEVEFKS